MTNDEKEMFEALIMAIDRVRDEIESHSKVMSKTAHVLGFKLEDIKNAIVHSKQQLTPAIGHNNT